MTIRPAQADDFDEVASLIHHSTNQWYETNRGHSIFDPADPLACRLFTDVYENFDPGCCLVAVSDDGKILGSCFYHPRETHVSLGIMNTHPEAAGSGVASMLLNEIIKYAGELPVRLVSSAMNLDSYSLYTKAGFTPRAMYQDMQLPQQPDFNKLPEYDGKIRIATHEDTVAMADLEMNLCGIRRENDYRHFIDNTSGIWRCLVAEKEGAITGFLNAVDHPASCMLGPGVAINWQDSLALIAAHHQAERETQPVFLTPADQKELISHLYQAGARNLELHVSQVRGESTPPKGIIMPTFMPETG